VPLKKNKSTKIKTNPPKFYFYLMTLTADFEPLVSITLLRHGETESNKSRRIQGHRPGKLSAKGCAQAEAAGARLRDEAQTYTGRGRIFDSIVSSDLERAAATARAATVHITAVRPAASTATTNDGSPETAAADGPVGGENVDDGDNDNFNVDNDDAGPPPPPPPPHLDPGLREKGSGVFEGEPLGAVEVEADKHGVHRRRFRPAGPSGESWEDVHARALAAISRLLDEHCPGWTADAAAQDAAVSTTATSTSAATTSTSAASSAPTTTATTTTTTAAAATTSTTATATTKSPSAPATSTTAPVPVSAAVAKQPAPTRNTLRASRPPKPVSLVEHRGGWPSALHAACVHRALLVTHGGFIRECANVVGSWTGRSPPRAAARNTSFSTYVFGRDRNTNQPAVALVRFNDTRHLDDAGEA
jgi:broad specificity phosphatase PhoE